MSEAHAICIRMKQTDVYCTHLILFWLHICIEHMQRALRIYVDMCKHSESDQDALQIVRMLYLWLLSVRKGISRNGYCLASK